jgi:hypothetical protein
MTGEQQSRKEKSAKSEKYLRRHFWGQQELLCSRFIVFTEARGRSFPEPLCQKKGVFWQRLFSSRFGRSQEFSRTRMQPSPCEFSMIGPAKYGKKKTLTNERLSKVS